MLTLTVPAEISGKETFMAPCEPFLAEHIRQVFAWFERLVVRLHTALYRTRSILTPICVPRRMGS